VAVAFGLKPMVRIIPFRGEYWHLKRPDLVRSLIYPVPDPRFPFLGVHFTKTNPTTVEVGPNAVLAFAREGYSRGNVSLQDLREIVTSPGIGRLMRNYWRTGARELLQSLVPHLLANSARSLLPSVQRSDFVRARSGVRAQAISPEGKLVDDFAFAKDEGVVAVLNAPSPAATASIAIGQEIANQFEP
jgi:L-2-hydroxyglutarate oxidase LhgO